MWGEPAGSLFERLEHGISLKRQARRQQLFGSYSQLISPSFRRPVVAQRTVREANLGSAKKEAEKKEGT